MSVQKVSNLHKTAICKRERGHGDLISIQTESGCGRPLAVCPQCKELYILDSDYVTGNKLDDFMRADSLGRKYEWIPLADYCLKVVA